jgi:O-antigen ligase
MNMPSTRDVLAIPVYFLFFIMMFIPRAYPAFRGALLVVSLAVMLFAGVWKCENFRLHPSVLLWTLFLAAVGLAFSLYGAALSTPGAIRMLTVYFIWPIIFTFMIGAITRLEHIERLTRVMIYALIAITVYSLMYILNGLGIWPDSMYFQLDEEQRFNNYGGFLVYWLKSVSSLIFLVPFIIATVLNTRATGFPVGRFQLMLSLTLGVLVAVLTGKKAVWVVLLLTPLITWFFVLMQPSAHIKSKSSRKNVIYGVLTALVAGLTLNVLVGSEVRWDIWKMLDYLERGFDFSATAGAEGNDSAFARAEQYASLMEGWRNSPFFGNGLGAAASVIRSGEYEWAYELSYLSLLFQTGIFGIAIYSTAIGWIYWHGIRILKSGGQLAAIMLPTLVGLTCFLIANATNPYLAKFDFMWTIFFPAALINFHLLRTAHARA